MNTRSNALLAFFCGMLLLGSVAHGAEPAVRIPKAGKGTPGLEAAQALSTITGVAISPLMGVSGVGAWKYFHTAPEQRATLSWYAQPYFWVPAILLVLVVFVKDSFGTMLPTAVKKPFDIAELVENKVSGLVAAGAFVPLIAAIFGAASSDRALLDDAGLAMINAASLLNVLTIPLAVATFVVVWMVSHVIHVLILISPFTSVDAALKTFRLFVLSTVTGTAAMNPYLGAVWSLLIILVCFLVAGWAFRSMVFGSVFAWDFLSFRSNRFKVEPDLNWVFAARQIASTPIRTYGRLSRGSQGELIFTYRPWLFLPTRTETLPPDKYAVGRGLIYSEVIRQEGENETAVFTLPPRFRSHEAELSSIYLLGGVHDIGVLRGAKSLWRSLTELFGSGSQTSKA